MKESFIKLKKYIELCSNMNSETRNTKIKSTTQSMETVT